MIFRVLWLTIFKEEMPSFCGTNGITPACSQFLGHLSAMSFAASGRSALGESLLSNSVLFLARPNLAHFGLYPFTQRLGTTSGVGNLMSPVTTSIWCRRVKFSGVGETSETRGLEWQSRLPWLLSHKGHVLCTAMGCTAFVSFKKWRVLQQHGCSWQLLAVPRLGSSPAFDERPNSFEGATSQWPGIAGVWSLACSAQCVIPLPANLCSGAHIGLAKDLLGLYCG